MTLAEVEELTGVPAEHIIEELGLPASVGSDAKLRQLKRIYGFEIEDVRRIAAAY
jgi:hypothetical protein